MMKTIKIGARSSRLSLVQTEKGLNELKKRFPRLSFETIPFSSPGDRDKNTDLRASDPDFFTRDLDDAVLDGSIRAAVHSAKDLPESLRDGLDWLWLPWREDPRDALVLKKEVSLDELEMTTDGSFRIGVSSERRETFCATRFPRAEQLPIRGNIEERIALLNDDQYDLLVMAAAALVRLGLEHRITEYVSVEELPPPDGQGYLAMTFKTGDPLFTQLRKAFVKSVVFAGSGPGDPGQVTVEVTEALRHCDVCLYDALAPIELLDYLPKNARALYVGKRSGAHAMSQDQICEKITEFARQGKSVVRLKGGDPGIFGRLAEEVDALNALSLPFTVMPGISSLNAATTGTGLNLTRRGVSRGFTVMTPRQSGSAEYAAVSVDEMLDFPRVFFMGTSEAANIAETLLDQGKSADLPATLIFDAGKATQEIVSMTLAELKDYKKKQGIYKPGILMIGQCADTRYLYPVNGALAGLRVLVTCSKSRADKTIRAIRAFNGIPIAKPLIETELTEDFESVLEALENIDWLIVTSPESIRRLFEALNKTNLDARILPKIAVCGPGTAAELADFGVQADLVAERDFGSKGLLEVAERFFTPQEKLLRMRSDLATPKLAESLRTAGFDVDDQVLYKTIARKDDAIPEFDAVLFASGSAVDAFVANWGVESLKGKIAVAIGEPTKKTLDSHQAPCELVTALEATVDSMIQTLAEHQSAKVRK